MEEGERAEAGEVGKAGIMGLVEDRDEEGETVEDKEDLIVKVEAAEETLVLVVEEAEAMAQCLRDQAVARKLQRIVLLRARAKEGPPGNESPSIPCPQTRPPQKADQVTELMR